MVTIKDMEMPRWCGECGMCKEETIEGVTSTYCESLNQDITWNGNRVDNCPLVEIEERKVGKWIVNKDTICCPFCNRRQKIGTAEVELLNTIFTGFKFCGYCGADMRGSENGKTN